MPTSSTTDADDTVCPICGKESICGGLGLIRYELPTDHPDFGKLFRCPNNPVENDQEWQQRLRNLSNLSAFADKTFDNFLHDISGYASEEQASLEYALGAAHSFAQNPSGWILFEGTYGCGKTHLAAAIGNARLAQGDTVLFITLPDLLDHLRASYGPSSELGYDETFERIRSAPLLILDDLGVENPSPWAQEKLFQLINHRYSFELPTVITTNVAIDRFDARIHSRLLDRITQRVGISAPDFRHKMPTHTQKLQSDLSLYDEMTFDAFDVHSNAYPDERKKLEKALRVAQSYAENPEGWLLLMGEYGTGKTHLAAAIALHRQQYVREEVMFLTVPDLLDYLRVAFDPSAKISLDERLQTVRNVPLLVLDDLGTENATSWAKEKLFQILDYRYLAKSPTVITTAKKLEEIDARIASRLLDSRRCLPFAITTRSYGRRLK